MTDILTNNLIEDIFVAEETDGKLTMRCKACDQYNANILANTIKLVQLLKIYSINRKSLKVNLGGS